MRKHSKIPIKNVTNNKKNDTSRNSYIHTSVLSRRVPTLFFVAEKRSWWIWVINLYRKPKNNSVIHYLVFQLAQVLCMYRYIPKNRKYWNTILHPNTGIPLTLTMKFQFKPLLASLSTKRTKKLMNWKKDLGINVE